MRRIGMRILSRVLGALAVLWVTATIAFLALRSIPGDPALAVLGGPGSNASDEALEQARERFGLDQPFFVQYLTMLRQIFTFQLGDSYSLQEPVTDVIGEQLPATLALTLLSLVLAWVLALTGAALAQGARGVFARILSGVEIVAAALPHFWLGVALVVVFSTWLGWLPAISRGDDPVGLVLPALTLAIPLAGYLGQVLHEGLLDARESPFVLAARARGESELGVFLRHTLRHAVGPAVSLTGWAFGSLVSGAVVVEEVFARQGLGRTLLRAVTDRDVPLVLGILMLIALAYILVTIVSDLIDAVIDPRRTEPASEDAR